MAVAPTDTGNKVKTGSRYAGVFSAGSMAVFIALGTFPPEQQTEILKSAHTMYQATHDFVGAAANIYYLVFPALAVYLTKLGINSSGFSVMMDKIFTAAKAGNVEAKVAIVNAAASPDIGSAGVVNPELAANPATPGNVVARASDLPKAA